MALDENHICFNLRGWAKSRSRALEAPEPFRYELNKENTLSSGFTEITYVFQPIPSVTHPSTAQSPSPSHVHLRCLLKTQGDTIEGGTGTPRGEHPQMRRRQIEANEVKS